MKGKKKRIQRCPNKGIKCQNGYLVSKCKDEKMDIHCKKERKIGRRIYCDRIRINRVGGGGWLVGGAYRGRRVSDGGESKKQRMS